MPLTLDQQVDKNASDIGALTRTMDRLAVMMEAGEKRHQEEMASLKSVTSDIGKSITALTDKMSIYASLKEDTATLKEEIRVTRHDVKTIFDGNNRALPIIQRDLDEAKTSIGRNDVRIAELEKWRDKADGARGVISGWVWPALGGGVLFVGWLFEHFIMPRMSGGGG